MTIAEVVANAQWIRQLRVERKQHVGKMLMGTLWPYCQIDNELTPCRMHRFLTAEIARVEAEMGLEPKS